MAGLVEFAHILREGLDRDQIRCLIQELENSLENDAKKPGRIGTSLERKRFARAGKCTCSCVCPASWSTMPVELLQLVFARLPLPKIIQLRSLSKSWNRSFTSEELEFMRACTDAGPRVFAMITDDGDFGVINFSQDVRYQVNPMVFFRRVNVRRTFGNNKCRGRRIGMHLLE